VRSSVTRRFLSIIAVVIATGGCGSATPTTALPAAAGTTQALPADAIAALPRPADNAAVFAGLLGAPTTPLQGDYAAMRDEIAKQLGPAVDAPVPLPPIAIPASFHSVSSDAMVVGFLVIDMAIVSRALPSKLAADTLSAMVKQVGGGPGRDGPDRVPREEQTQSTPFDATTGSSTATGSMETKTAVQAERSLVTVDLDRTLTLNYTKDGQSGTVVVGIHNTESVDFCPDAGGVVPVKVHSEFTMATPASTVTATIDGTFQGQVDGQAGLASVTGNATVKGVTVTGGSSSDDYDASMSGVTIGTPGTIDGGTWAGHGDGAEAAVGAAVVDLENSVPTIFDGARRLWQKSACISVQLPDSGSWASYADSDDASTNKDVDPASKTEFTIAVHHRFLHTDVNIPVKLTLETVKKIDPTTVASTPGKATYEAPNKPSQNNKVRLEAKSVRGATRYAINFHTKDLKLKLSLTGHFVEKENGPLSATLTMDMKLKTVVFGPAGGTDDEPQYEATGTVNGTLVFHFEGLNYPCDVYATESGTVPLIAVLTPKDDDTSVWRIHVDQSGTRLHTTGTCLILSGSNDFGAGAGEIAKFFAALAEFEVPMDPGTYSVSGTRQIPIGTDTSTAKVTIYEPPR
jgi:hypothetical protein